MEAVPRLPMLWFALKSSPEGTSFANLKKYIAECYQEDPESYSKEVYALETLRNKAMRPEKDGDGCATLKRYYCQIHSLANRFPHIKESNLFTFTWKDLYVNNINEVTDIRYEMAAVLFNIAALHTQVGASVSRVDIDGMKLACTHFQCAAWAFGELKEKYPNVSNGTDFMTPELLVFMQQVSFAQAQECILEKSLVDNRRPGIIAKVTSQIINYYGTALVALLTGGDDGSIAQVIDSNVYKAWKKFVKFKISYLNCILFLCQGQQAEELQEMGERVVLYQAAWNKLEEARKESKGLAEQKEIMESLTFTADVVEGKRKAATNENEFIYHEAVPDISEIPAVQGANLVNGISFSITDPEVMGEDIFARLVPMKAHEASSLYSEEKAKILRRIGEEIEEKDNELNTFLSSLNLEHLNVSEERSSKIPQGIVDRCASLNAKTNAIPDLIASMSSLAEICADVETNLKDIKEFLSEEDMNEKQYQQKSGVHRSNAHITELSREFQKYLEAHQKAGESNDTLRRAMELHVNNLRILSKPLPEIQSSIPKLSGDVNESVFHDLKLILNKVNEMKAQRAQFHADLRISVNNDDITSKVIACGDEKNLKDLFKEELEKHEKICALIEQNLTAQANILSALTEAYAKCAPILKTMADVKHKKENFFSSLAASYDVYEDLLAKSAKGLEFYKKLQGNVQKLLARVKAARDVQDEERQQRLKSTKPAKPIENSALNLINNSNKSTTPKLKDYLKSGKGVTSVDTTYIPPIRPNPLGSETPATSTCVTSMPIYYSAQNLAHEAPPNYATAMQQYYDANGYTNPIYQNSQYPNPNLGSYDPQNYYQTQLQNQQAAANQQVTYQPSNYSVASSTSQPQTVNPYQYSSQSAAVPSQSTDQQYNVAYPQEPASTGYQQPALQYPSQQYDQQAAYTNQSQYPQSVQNSIPNINSTTSQIGQTSAYSQQIAQSATISAYNQQYSTTTTPSTAYNQQYSQVQPAASVAPSAYIQQSQYNQQQYTTSTTPDTTYSQNAAYVTTASITAFNQQNQSVQINTQIPNATSTTDVYAAGQISGYVTPSSSSAVGVTNQMENLSLQNPLQTAEIYNPYPQPYDTKQSAQPKATDSQYNYQQPNQAAPSTADVPVTSLNQQTYSSYGSHPGYMFNQQTGEYQYASGYQKDGGNYSPYTNSVHNQTGSVTDTVNAGPTWNQQGYVNQQPIPPPPADNTGQTLAGNVSYYTTPYGYQSATETSSSQMSVSGGYTSQPENQSYSNQSAMTYMQSNTNNTQTINSDQASSFVINSNGYNQAHPMAQQQAIQPANQTQESATVQQYPSQIQQQYPTQPQQIQNQSNIQSSPSHSTTVQEQTNQQTKKSQPKKSSTSRKSSNIDLLSDIDFSISATSISTPPLQPQPAPVLLDSKPPSQAPVPLESKSSIDLPKELPTPDIAKSFESIPPQNLFQDRKSSCDNLSICSDLSSLDHSFDWDSISIRNEPTGQNVATLEPSSKFKDPFDDPKILKYFHKEVERFEKIIETLNIKMLNGNTPLATKWKELQDLLVKDETKRTTSVGKLFPEKNRSTDCIPYDHARVILERNTDDYINAAFVKELGPGCPVFILAQTPLQNTLNDFWSMIWAQKARTVVCLHTPNEILDTYWPQDTNKEMHFDDFSVTLVKQFDLSHCTECSLKLTMNGADAILDLSVLQIKAWTKSSPAQILGIAQNVLVAYKQRSQEFKSNSPLIMNCLTGSERSGIISLSICAILATKSKRPILINVVDVWYRICSQRKGALRDTNNLELSMQIVLSHAHDVLNKRGIMTSYQMKNAQTTTAIEKEEIKDPLNDLDPLWKLKQK